MRRVVVTGMGMVTPLGCGVEATWRRLIAGESGIRKIDRFEASDIPCRIAGMVPMALGLGEGGDQVAPLGRAVIGGLAAGTLTTLFVLPALFALLMTDQVRPVSIDPFDPESRHYVPEVPLVRPGGPHDS